MGGQEENHIQYASVVDNTSSYEPIATPTLSNPFGGVMRFRKKVSKVPIRNFIKFGVDKKATHLWNKHLSA